MTKEISKPPIIHLDKELLLQVDGEEEKSHTLDWNILRNIGDSTQKLLQKLVQFSTETDFPPDLFKLEFINLLPGSAIPDFRIVAQQNLLYPLKNFYKTINSEFSYVMGCVNDGNFKKIADKYNEPAVRNQIIDSVFDFTNAAGTKPVNIVRRAGINKFRTIAKVRHMTLKQKVMLHASVPESQFPVMGTTEIEAVGKFLLKKNSKGRITKKDVQLYTQKEAILSLKFDSIETDKRIYQFNNEVLFSMVNENKKSVTIENTALDIYAYGLTMEEAQQDLFEQFDYTFQRLNQVEDNKLSEHLLTAKKYINLIVHSVKNK